MYNTGNCYQRGRSWEREISFEFFEVNGERAIAQNAGVRIHGGTSRRYAHKSLRIYARSDYGESYLNHQIFPEDRKSTRLNSSHVAISYAVFCLTKKIKIKT